MYPSSGAPSRPRHRWRGLARLAVATALVAAACGGGDDDDAASTDPASAGTAAPSADGGSAEGSAAPAEDAERTLNLAIQATDQPLDPAVFYGGIANSIRLAIYESLITYESGTNELVGQLAESWEESEDGLSYTFHLREGVTFHDGTPFDAEAVKYNIERSQEIQGSPYWLVEPIQSVEVVDPLTVTLTLAEPNVGFLDLFASPYGPAFASPTAIEANRGTDFGQTWLVDHAVGTGPYMLTELIDSQSYKLEAYPDHWSGEVPDFKYINYAVIPEYTTQLLQFEGGELDMLTTGIGALDLQRLETTDGYSVTYRPTTASRCLMINPTKVPDEEFRRAIWAALDKDQILDTAYQQLLTKAEGFYPVPLASPETAAPDLTYDPSILANLLEEHPEYAQETLLLRHSAPASDTQAAELIQAQLQAAGLQVEIRVFMSGEAYEVMEDPAGPDAGHLLLTCGTNDTANVTSFANTWLMTEAPVNFAQISVPAADEAHALAQVTLDEAERTEHLRTAAEEWLASGQIYPIGDVVGFAAMRTDKLAPEFEYHLVNNGGVALESLQAADGT